MVQCAECLCTHPEGVNHLVNVVHTVGNIRAKHHLPSLIRNVSGNLFMKSTTAGWSQLLAELNVFKKIPSLHRTCNAVLHSPESQLQKRRLLLPFHPPRCPSATDGFEFSSSCIFRQLVAMLKSHFVKSSRHRQRSSATATGFPRSPLGISTFTSFCRCGFPGSPLGIVSENTYCTSTKPISVSVELSLLLLLSAACGTSGCFTRLFDSPCCSTFASVISVSCSKLRFASGGGSTGGGAGGGGNAEPLLLLSPFW